MKITVINGTEKTRRNLASERDISGAFPGKGGNHGILPA